MNIAMSKNENIINEKIDKLLTTDDFMLDIEYLKAIHKYLFDGIVTPAGDFRKCNLNRPEEILNGKTILYANYYSIEEYLRYDFNEIKTINDYNETVKIKKMVNFTSSIWQAHPFMDGNTRTILIFVLKYLKYLNYEIAKELYTTDRIYFRNSLVLANYYDYNLDIRPNKEYLSNYFKKIITGDNIELDNRMFNQDKVKKLIKS